MPKNKWYTKQVQTRINNGGYKGLVATAEPIGDEAQRITPLDTGELETSMHIDGSKKALKVVISFSKIVDGVDVATIQHEDLTLNHLPGKEAKYLQKPLFALGPGLLPYVLADELRKVLK